jgi:alkylation response protein AidB-like acyl-CoA dehydrogenase
MNLDPASFRLALTDWLDAHPELAPDHAGHPALDLELTQFRRVKRALFDADFGRYGWPESVGGLGGSPLLRAIVGEEIAMRDLAEVGIWSMIEVLAPAVIATAPAALVAETVPPLLRGDEFWCQGFSEPGSGSDLASLSCTATPAVVGGVDGWSITGQKVWTSYAQLAERCVLLARTGEPGSAHRGITAFMVNMSTPGITPREIEIQNGAREFCEVFFDDAFVPDDRRICDVGAGWKLAMDILPYERSTAFWHKGAFLQHRFDQLLAQVAPKLDESPELTPSTEHALGEAFQAILAFRSRSRSTQHQLAAGVDLGADTSIDKILVASAEQLLFETARDLLAGVIEFDTDEEAAQWRREALYSRAATIYGGTGEIQRNIVANRLLKLGPES